MACSALNMITKYNGLWRMMCQLHYGIIVHTNSEAFYKKILMKYGSLLGTWIREDYPVGGLLQVKYHDNNILGSNWRPHPTLGQPLKKTNIFKIELDTNNDVLIQCSIDNSAQHLCKLNLEGKTQCSVFETKCNQPNIHFGKNIFLQSKWVEANH